MHITDPAFADTELAGSNVSPFPLIGLARTTRPQRRPSIDPKADLVFNFADPERVRRERSMRVTATREQERLKIEADVRLASAVDAAWRNGKAEGEAAGYAKGWKHGTNWGIFCGAFGTCLLVAIAVVGLVVYVGRRVPLF